MKFDRIFEDSLGFIRRKLWSEAENKSTCKQPFQAKHSFQSDYGVVSLLEGRDTPRAIRTWMFSPKRRDMNSAKMVSTKATMDLHIYVDFLGPLPGAKTPMAVEERETRAKKRQRGEVVFTHRVQVLKASHFLNASGFYDCEVVFWKDYEFYIKDGLKPDRLAQKVADRVARYCLEMANPMKLEAAEWEETVNRAWREIRGEQTKL